MENKKICTKCGEEKPVTEFYQDSRRGKIITVCKDCKRKKNLANYQKNKQYFLDHRQKTYWRNADKHRLKEKNRYDDLRKAAINNYGGVCACCGESEYLFLEIDHTNGDGAGHRREIGRSAKALVTWLRDNNYPNDFQILCANCNQGKKRNGGICPHQQQGNNPEG